MVKLLAHRVHTDFQKKTEQRFFFVNYKKRAISDFLIGLWYLALSAKSSVNPLRASGRPFTIGRNKNGPIMEPCGTPRRFGMVTESSPLTPSKACINQLHDGTTKTEGIEKKFKIKADDLNGVAFVHHARHCFRLTRRLERQDRRARESCWWGENACVSLRKETHEAFLKTPAGPSFLSIGHKVAKRQKVSTTVIIREMVDSFAKGSAKI